MSVSMLRAVDDVVTPPRSAVVTGGGTGIGAAIVAALAADGCRVVSVGRRAEVLQTAAEKVNGDLGRELVSPYRADLTDVDDVAALADHVGAAIGEVDVLVNNAGGADHRPLDTLAAVADHWRATLSQNLISAILVTHALKPLLRRPGGRVIAISSAASRGRGGEVAYASSKAAMNRWVLSLATELGGDGITANVVLPGFVPATELYGPDGAPDERRAQSARAIAVGRAGEPEDVAAMVRFLASEEASWVSAATVEVDGGVKVML